MYISKRTLRSAAGFIFKSITALSGAMMIYTGYKVIEAAVSSIGEDVSSKEKETK